MSLNTFVWGFTCELAETIDILTENGTIARKCWISRLWHRRDKLLKQKSILKESTFYSNRWLKVYHDQVSDYRKSVAFDFETYHKVYRKLYVFIDNYSRHDHRLHQKSLHHYINQFNLLYHFLYSVFIKEKIQLVLFDCIPHLGVELIIYEIAKVLNIRTIMVMQSHIPDKFYYIEDIEDFGDFKSMSHQEDIETIKIEKTFFMDHFYMRRVKRFRFSFLNAVVRSFRKPHKLFEEFSYNYQRYRRVKRYRKNLERIISHPVDYEQKYVYFPLHLQPELTTSALGGIFNDQLLALEILSGMIPEDWKIYIKENPKQTDFMRDPAFFERLKLIENVKMVPLDENTFKLIEHSQFVATITGTAGWEAICGGKPALVFGKIWYQNFEGVFRWHPNVDVQKIADYRIDHAKLEKDYTELISKCATGTVDRDYCCLVENFDDKKNTQLLSSFLARYISSNTSNSQSLKEAS